MVFPHRPPATIRFAAYSVAVVNLAIGVGLVMMGVQSPRASGLQFGGLVLIATCWLPPWILLAVRYELAGGELRIHHGPLTRAIALDTIDEVRASSPLPGLEGVIVSYRKKGRRVREPFYPGDPASFLREVQESAPFLSAIDHGTLRRAT